MVSEEAVSEAGSHNLILNCDCLVEIGFHSYYFYVFVEAPIS